MKLHLRRDEPNYPGENLIIPDTSTWESAFDTVDSVVYCWQCISELVVNIHRNMDLSIITPHENYNSDKNPEYANTIE